MKKLFMISTMLFNWLLIPSVHAIYDVVAIDIIPQGDQVKFCLDLDTHNKRKTKFYVAAIVGNKVIFIEPTSNGNFTPHDFAINPKPPPFSQWNKSANALCLTPLPKTTLQGIELYAAVGASLTSIKKKESYRRIFNGFPTLPQSSQNWTVMVYMVGSDLEHNSKRCIREQDSDTCKRAASTDILEMLEGSKQPSATSLVVSTGGSMRTGWQTVKRSLIQNGQLSVLEDIGAQDMADSNTLSEFVLWAKTNFPAQNYALILWSHGKATQGIGPDSNSEKMMTLPELSKAYQDIKAQSGTLDIVIYDACLMASIEVAQVTSIVANAMAASVEVEPNYGLNYVDLMHQMGTNPPQNGLALGKLVKSGYIQYSKDKKKLNTKKTYFEIDQIAYSVFDLTTLSAFNDKLIHFASQFQTVLEEGSYVNYKSMSQGLIRATGYPFTWVEGKYRGNELETNNLFIDLTNFLQNVAERLPDVQAPANEVLTALDQVVIDYESNLGTINPNLETINPNAGRVSIDIGQNDAYLSNLSDFAAYKLIRKGITAYKQRKENDVLNPEGNLVPANCPPSVVCADVPNWLELSAEENAEQKVYGVDAYFGQTSGNISNIYLIKRGIYRTKKVTEDLKIPLSGNEACSYQLCVTDDHCENITLTAQGHLLLADADVNESSAVVSFCQDETNDQWLACSVVTQNENVWGRAEELYPGDSITPSTLHVQNGQKEIRTGNTLFVESEPVGLKQQCSLPEATIVAVYYGANGQPQFQQLCVGKHCENAGVIIHP